MLTPLSLNAKFGPRRNYHNSVLNVKAVVATINQEKALVGAFFVITNLRMELFEALVPNPVVTYFFFSLTIGPLSMRQT